MYATNMKERDHGKFRRSPQPGNECHIVGMNEIQKRSSNAVRGFQICHRFDVCTHFLDEPTLIGGPECNRNRLWPRSGRITAPWFDQGLLSAFDLSRLQLATNERFVLCASRSSRSPSVGSTNSAPIRSSWCGPSAPCFLGLPAGGVEKVNSNAGRRGVDHPVPKPAFLGIPSIMYLSRHSVSRQGERPGFCSFMFLVLHPQISDLWRSSIHLAARCQRGGGELSPAIEKIDILIVCHDQ